ncbi:MAG: hypothetical protein GY730_00120 [bacterium]|nr:hypothetical protein [bacterium]
MKILIDLNIIKKEKLPEQINVTLHHEISSPLTSIMIGSQALSEWFADGSDEKHVISHIKDCSKRIKETMGSSGNLKNIIIDEYLDGIKMVNLSKSKGL